MKKVLLTMTLLLTLSMGLQAAGQKHRHTPRKEQVDSTNQGGIEVFSDTTSADTATVTRKVTVTTRTSPWSTTSTTYDVDGDDLGSIVGSLSRSSTNWHVRVIRRRLSLLSRTSLIWTTVSQV